jgi:hypothetical protein
MYKGNMFFQLLFFRAVEITKAAQNMVTFNVSMPLLVWLSCAELRAEKIRPRVYENGL